MKLSILMVSYNELDYLSEAIESCMDNDCDYEIIIGDDGSTDGSIEFITKYVERYPEKIKYFVMDREKTENIDNIIPSVRVSNVLKKSFKMCSGDYITVISGDDINTLPNRYLKQVEYLDKHRQYSSCYVDYKKFWNNKEEEMCQLKLSTNGNIFWATEYVHISCFVFRRECLNNLLPRFCDDTGLIYSILVTGKSKHLKMNGFGYRQRDKSIMHEADRLELCLLEIALFQDCLNFGHMKKSSFSRFYIPMSYLLNNRDKIVQKKYKKYISEAQKYPNNVLQSIISDEKTAYDFVKRGCVCYWIFKCLRKINIITSSLLTK